MNLIVKLCDRCHNPTNGDSFTSLRDWRIELCKRCFIKEVKS